MIYVFFFFFLLDVCGALSLLCRTSQLRVGMKTKIKARERASVDRLPTRWFSLVCACGEIALYQNVSN